MPTLLRIDSSPMFHGSVSRHLTEEFVRRWQALHPDGRLISRDLNTTDLQPVTADWVAASRTPEPDLTPEQSRLLGLSDALIAELDTADEYVFGVPMHNFSIPSVLKLWIDLIARPGKTFSYDGGRAKGLLQGKKVTFLVASGGVYDAGTTLASFNFVEPYLRAAFAFLGITDCTFINAGGTMAVALGQADRTAFLKPYVEAIGAHISRA